ncbi:MAG: hypothetical protein AAGA56_12445 [Myxococcota bacterium]
MCRSVSLGLLGLFSAASVSLTARAEVPCAPDDGRSASERKQRGVSAYKRAERKKSVEDYRRAARCFELAHEGEPSGPVLFNAAASWAAGEEPARAADAYAQAMSQGGLESDYRRLARERLVKASRELTVIDVVAPRGKTLRVAHVEATIPTTFHLSPGAHQIVLSCGDGAVTTALTARAGDKERLELQCPTPTPAPAAVVSPPPSADADDGASGLAIGGWSLLGVGAAAGIAAGGLGWVTLQARDEFRESEDEADRDRGERLQLATNITAFSAVALGLVGTTLLVYDVLQDDDETVSVSLYPTGFNFVRRW